MITNIVVIFVLLMILEFLLVYNLTKNSTDKAIVGRIIKMMEQIVEDKDLEYEDKKFALDLCEFITKTLILEWDKLK